MLGPALATQVFPRPGVSARISCDMAIMRWSATRQPIGAMIGIGKRQTEDHTTQIRSIGIDLGKTTFHLVALGSRP
jgi:hypothetical protein